MLLHLKVSGMACPEIFVEGTWSCQKSDKFAFLIRVHSRVFAAKKV
jgi:hypothetical protein